MKNWIQAWKVSCALDSTHRKKPHATSPNALSLNAIHERLSCCSPSIQPTGDLHHSIMKAVRRQPEIASSRVGVPPCSSVLFGMLLSRSGAVACLLVALVGIGVLLWTIRPQPDTTQSVQAPAQLSPEVASALQILGSLEQEMEHLNSDLRITANHLLASLP